MKLIGVMSLEKEKDAIRKLFEKHGVQMFSEIGISGHTVSTIEEYGWWPSDGDVAVYSTLCFAVISKYHADEIMNEISKLAEAEDSVHPIRAFQVDVEKMI
ncbi:MAG: hypothetical protein JSW58_14245 [Candidatus Latescibacterota bacterium]|nr:MAG: hypothetical protein JSW58_14245 [Candidatus Latescibacterota bacterium]